MTPMVWWSVIINEAGSAPLNMRSRIPQVTDGERQGGTGMGQHPEHAVWSEERKGSVEDVCKCLEISRLELYQIW